jgi:hypothetical protein
LTSESSKPDGSHVFFALINAVLIVLSNVAFQQYALYKLEADRVQQSIDGLGGEYSKSLMTESIIEMKNTLALSQMLLLSQRSVMEGLDILLAREHGLTGNLSREEAADLLERNSRLEELIREVANTSSYVAVTGPNLPEYDQKIADEIASLKARKSEASASGSLLWDAGLLLIINALVLTLYSLYLSQFQAQDDSEEKYIRLMKIASTLQMVAAMMVIFGSFIGLVRSSLWLTVMNVLMLVTVALMALQTGTHVMNARKKTEGAEQKMD